MNAVSIEISAIGCPACRPMYSSARAVAFCSASLFESAGVGTEAPIIADMPGDVPQVTYGAILPAWTVTVRSNFASGSVANARQDTTDSSHLELDGAFGL